MMSFSSRIPTIEWNKCIEKSKKDIKKIFKKIKSANTYDIHEFKINLKDIRIVTFTAYFKESVENLFKYIIEKKKKKANLIEKKFIIKLQLKNTSLINTTNIPFFDRGIEKMIKMGGKNIELEVDMQENPKLVDFKERDVQGCINSKCILKIITKKQQSDSVNDGNKSTYNNVNGSSQNSQSYNIVHDSFQNSTETSENFKCLGVHDNEIVEEEGSDENKIDESSSMDTEGEVSDEEETYDDGDEYEGYNQNPGRKQLKTK